MSFISMSCLISALLALLTLCQSVQASLTVTSSKPHEAVLLSPLSATKWLVFPTAKTQHRELRLQYTSTDFASASSVPATDKVTESSSTGDYQDFFSVHNDVLSLHPACEMTLTQERRNPSSSLGKHQYINLHIN
jgi:hypothetical protein